MLLDSFGDTSVGYLALSLPESTANYNGGAKDNSAFGFGTLQSNTTGYGNVAAGWTALQINTTGNDNVAVGERTLTSNTSGYFNVAVGSYSLSGNDSGTYNTAVGFEALVQAGASNYNTAIGSEALYSATGTYNIGVGYDAGNNLTTGNGNIYIGSTGVDGESNTIRIGAPVTDPFLPSQTALYIQGINGAKTGLTPASQVLIDANGQLGTIQSSRRYKEDIQPMADASDRLLKLRPVQFRYKKPDVNGEKPIQYGLIAEEVAQVLPELVVRNQDGQPETVAYHLLPAMLLNELQKQHVQLTAQERVIHDQAAQIAQLQAQASEVATLKARLADLERVTALLAKLNSADEATAQPVSQRATESGGAAVAAR